MLYVYDRVYETLKLTKNVSKCTGWQTFSRSERLDGISLKKLHEDKREVCREGGGGSMGPLSSTLDTINPIDIIYNHIWHM